MKNRRIAAHLLRYEAADVAYNRPHSYQRSNGEENRYRITGGDGKSYPSYIAAFTKGFRHDENGFMVKPEADDYQFFIRACDVGTLEAIQDLNLNKDINWKSEIAKKVNAKVRGWESMGAGLTYELEGPDPQSLAIPPAPTLSSDELIAEMMELYWMALCRDVPFTEFGSNANIGDALFDINPLPWFVTRSSYGLHPYEVARKRGYFKDDADANDLTRMKPGDLPFTRKDIFRGNVHGDDIGFYVSQFLYVGNKALHTKDVAPLFGQEEGRIGYGSMTADQRVRIAKPGLDYMTTWKQWLDVQNGANLRSLEEYAGTTVADGYRFIWTPRDLATYVHYDALHQAYFNACLILLGIDAPFDPGMPFRLPDSVDKQTGFAQFGGPHILNLVSEVATRALKAVRFQKYNVHRRIRPEVVGGWIHRYATGHTDHLSVVKNMVEVFNNPDPAKTKKVWITVRDYNKSLNGLPDRDTDGFKTKDSFLLPMPFVEGSPMHPSYGSGHATVAGACVTILKAFFDEGYELPFAYVPANNGTTLTEDPIFKGKLTVENELNKLAANIAFGRDWAGVHYWSDQAESLRLGEQIALGILEEQKMMYGENFSMNVPLFDGTSVRI